MFGALRLGLVLAAALVPLSSGAVAGEVDGCRASGTRGSSGTDGQYWNGSTLPIETLREYLGLAWPDKAVWISRFDDAALIATAEALVADVHLPLLTPHDEGDPGVHGEIACHRRGA